MAASNYSVNIKLNTKPAIDQLGKLEKRVNVLRRKLNTPLRIESKAVMLKKQQLALDDRKFATMKITRRLGEQLRKLEKDGLNVDKEKLQLSNAARHTAKGRLETARASNKLVADEIKGLQKVVSLNKQAVKSRIASPTVVSHPGLMGPHQATKGAGQVAQDVDFRLKQQKKRLGFEVKLRELEFKGVNTKKLRLKMGELVDAQNRAQLGSIKQINAQLGNGITKEVAKLRILEKQNKQRKDFLKGGRTGFKAASGSMVKGEYGAQMLPTKGAGQVAMGIDTNLKEQETGLKLAHELNILELKGAKISEIKSKLNKRIVAQRKGEFGEVKRLNREIRTGVQEEKNRLALLKERERQNPSKKGRLGSIVNSALISGSFPLLFGQGIPGAIAGGLGGGIGAAVGGQMGGFAGGLVATSLLQIFNNTADRLNTLGSALNDPSKNIQVLTERIKFFDKSVGTTISTLQSAGLERTAAELARITLENRVGPRQLTPIKMLNEEMDKFGMLARDLGMKINSVVAGPLTAFFKFMNLTMGGKNKTSKEDSNKTVKQSITESLNKFEKLKPELYTSRSNLKTLDEQIEKNKKIIDLAKERVRNGERIVNVQKSLQNEITDAANEINSAGLLDRQIGFTEDMSLRRFENINDGLKRERSIQKDNLKLLEQKVGDAEELVEIFKIEEQILKAQGNELRDQLKLQEVQSSVIRGDKSEKDLAIKRKEVELNKVNRKLELERAELKIIERDGNEREKQAQREKVKNLELERDLVVAIANERINAADPAISRMDELNRKMRDLNDTTLQAVNLSKAMGESFEESFKGIVYGTMTVQDAFRNMLNRIADFFIDTAAQIAATQLQRSILGLFGNMFNFSTTPLNDIQNTNAKLAANGGPVGMKNPYIVGERGPELFVPNQSGNIIPNHDLAGIGGGTTNIVVNVDASGSSVEGDEDRGRELGRLISVAIQSELIQQKRPGGLLA